MKILITGGAGYVGAMLGDQFARREDVDSILIIDKESFPALLENHPNKNKFIYIQDNLANESWQKQAKEFAPDVIIHTAWQIREDYAKRNTKWKMNIAASLNVFDLAFSAPSVKRLIHFSTVASYGAFPDNETDRLFTEEEAFRISEYSYAEEKRIAEENLRAKYAAARKDSNRFVPQVVIVRPVAITGPRGRYGHIRFGLQSALAGTLKKDRSLINRSVSLAVAWVPVTPKWARQYIHEDDVTDIVRTLTFGDLMSDFDTFNISPPGPFVTGKEMAEAVNKRTLPVKPWMVRAAFFFARHLTRGRIPTSVGVWKGYSYPILVDGSKITKVYGYKYKFSSKEAFTKIEGRYADDAQKEIH